MAKRTIEGYRPIVDSVKDAKWSLDLAFVDQLIAIAGQLPNARFDVLNPHEQGQWKEGCDCANVKLSAREYLVHELTAAARRYFRERLSQSEPTAAQLSVSFASIEDAAHTLLSELGVGRNGNVDRMPSALRFGGLQAEAGTDDLVEGGLRLKGAIKGVHLLHQWARSAKTRQQRRKALSGKSLARNEGDKALNEYVHEVIVNCWEVLYERDAKVGPQLTKFAIVAAKAVGASLAGDEASVSRRLQRILSSARPKRVTRQIKSD
jgi:hypothetical protein